MLIYIQLHSYHRGDILLVQGYQVDLADHCFQECPARGGKYVLTGTNKNNVGYNYLSSILPICLTVSIILSIKLCTNVPFYPSVSYVSTVYLLIPMYVSHGTLTLYDHW